VGKNTKKILVSGYGWTGSGALRDMLQEYRSISIIPREFDDFRIPGAVGDVIFGKIHSQEVIVGPSIKSASIAYMSKFITRGLIPDFLWPNSFKGKGVTRAYALKLGVRLLRERGLYKNCLKNISDASNEYEVFKAGSDWIDSVASLYSGDAPFVVFDQPIIYDCHGELWPKIFSNARLILVTRNPLDQMGAILREGPQFIRPVPWNVEFLYGRDAYKNRPLSFFMETTLERYSLISETYNRIGADNMLVIKFESLINDYEETKKHVEKFIGISPADHAKVFEHFNPDDSKLGMDTRGELCSATYAKAVKLEEKYLNMLSDVNAV
jgi:hypothetical protein